MVRKAANLAKWQRKAKRTSKSQKLIKLQTQCKPFPLDRYYHVFSHNHPISKSSTNFLYNLSPFGNELIKHNLREEQDAMHEIKIRVFHKVYKHVFKQLYSTIIPRHAKTIVNPHKRPQKDIKYVAMS
jgi:hypothetical protein